MNNHNLLFEIKRKGVADPPQASPLNSEIFGWFFSQQDVVVPRFFIDLWHKGVFINKTRHVNQLIQGERRLSHLKIKESCVNA